jgi:DNA-binding transcriptional LysR family regulator
MEIYQLRAFVAVARTGHLTRAAEQLHLTQSAVSKQLKALEEQLGAPLFERSASGMTLSIVGKRLMPLAVRTLDAAAEITSTAKLLQGKLSGTLRLGTIIDPKSIRLGELLSGMKQRYPEIEVKLEHGISGSVLNRLKAEELDACFFLGTVDDPNLKMVELTIEWYAVAAPAAWKERVTGSVWAELARMPWVGTPKGSSQTALIEKVMKDQGLSRETVVEADQESSMVDLVDAGVGLCLIRERLAADLLPAKNIVLWDGDKIACPLSIIMRTADAARPLPTALLEVVFSIWPSAVYR